LTLDEHEFFPSPQASLKPGHVVARRTQRPLVRNLVHGMIVSAQAHPLIFETSSGEDNEMVRLRSLSSFDQLLADAENGVSKYRSLNNERKRIVAVGVRDLFLGAWHGMLNEQEKRILDGMVKMLDETVGCIQAMGINISFHPPANFKVVKLIEALDGVMGHEWAPLFAQVMHTPKLFAVFVDPAESSFYNLENIVPLDFLDRMETGGRARWRVVVVIS
jgi:hypothetical protein